MATTKGQVTPRHVRPDAHCLQPVVTRAHTHQLARVCSHSGMQTPMREHPHPSVPECTCAHSHTPMHTLTPQGPGLGLPVPDGKLSNASRPPVSHRTATLWLQTLPVTGGGGGWKSVSRASRWARPQPPPCNSACADVCGALWVVGRARLPHGELQSVWWRFWERLRRARLFPHGAASVSRDSTHSSSCASAAGLPGVGA